MKTCEIIIIGNEVLQGHIQDTNSRWIARRLTELGFDVKGIFVVGDIVEDIVGTLSFLMKLNLDLIFVCGGLGPTPDDKTFEAIAKCFNLELLEDKSVSDDIIRKVSFLIEKHIVDIEHVTTEQTKWILKMSHIPEGSIPLKNSLGLAPGIMLSVNEKLIFVLPGVPVEMKTIFAEEVEPKMGIGEKRAVKEVVLKAEESIFCDLVEKLENQYRRITIGMYPRYGRMELTIRIVGNEAEASCVMEEIKKEAEKLGVKISKQINEPSTRLL
jgi:nicotinamide-nucleotide amidase